LHKESSKKLLVNRYQKIILCDILVIVVVVDADAVAVVRNYSC